MVEIEDLIYLVRNKKYEEALELVHQLKGNLEKALALGAMAKEVSHIDETIAYSLLEDAEYFSEKIAEMSRRVRILEEKTSQLRNKIEVVNNSLLNSKKAFVEETKEINISIKDIKRTVENFLILY